MTMMSSGVSTKSPAEARAAEPKQVLSFSYDFSHGSHGWLVNFAEYTEGMDLQLLAELRQVPPADLPDRAGLFVRSMNRSDDVFAFLRKYLGPENGIVAGRSYRISYEIEFASNEPAGQRGIGGDPAKAVVVKAGASAVEPLAVLDGGFVKINVEKGAQQAGGVCASVVGDIANGRDSHDPKQYAVVRKSHTHEKVVTAGPEGQFWLLVGTDSGYEGLTALYWLTINVRLESV
ncbi:MAG: hypothetical protein ACHREM_16760 [Polyangiales bacterium]